MHLFYLHFLGSEELLFEDLDAYVGSVQFLHIRRENGIIL